MRGDGPRDGIMKQENEAKGWLRGKNSCEKVRRLRGS